MDVEIVDKPIIIEGFNLINQKRRKLRLRLKSHSYVTEIIIRIKQFNPGQIALNSFIASNCRYMVHPLSYNITIENGLLDQTIRQMVEKISEIH